MARVRADDRTYIDMQTKREVLSACGHKCGHCGKQVTLGKTFTVDHVIPLDKGGTNEPDNYAALCEDCNRDKSNLIVNPSQFYTELPKAKLNAICAYVERFMEKNDWLHTSNLFAYDWFMTTYYQSLLIGKGTRIISRPRPCLVRRLSPEQTVEMICQYADACVTTERGKSCLTTTLDRVEALNRPFYSIYDEGRYVGSFSAYIQEAELINRNGTDTRQNRIYIDLFRNPTASYRPHKSCRDIAAILHLVNQEILVSFKAKSPDAMMVATVRGIHDDPYMQKAFTDLCAENRAFDPVLFEGERSGLDSDILEVEYVLYTGTRQQAKELSETGLTQTQLTEYQKPLDDRIAATDEELVKAKEQHKSKQAFEKMLRDFSSGDVQSRPHQGSKKKKGRKR